MPRISPIGDVWAGMGDNIVSLNGQRIALGGTAYALDARRGIFQVGAELYTYDVGTEELLRVDLQGANDLRASVGIYQATFHGILRVSNRPQTYPGYFCGDIGPDGTVLMLRPDGTFEGHVPDPGTLQSFGGNVWSMTVGYRPLCQNVANVPVPRGDIYGLRRSGDYACYQHAGRFLVQRISTGKAWIQENVPNAFRPDVVVLEDGMIRYAYATGQAELPHEIITDTLRPEDCSQDVEPRPDPGPTPPTDLPPRVTIKSYSPTSGDAPLTVTAVYAESEGSGRIRSLHWLYSADEGRSWTDATPQGNDPNDPDHHYQFPREGTYLIRLRAIGPGGEDLTIKRRAVTVGAFVPPEPPHPTPDPEKTFTLRRHDWLDVIGMNAEGFLGIGAGYASMSFSYVDGALKARNGQFVHFEHDGRLLANRDAAGSEERAERTINADQTVSFKGWRGFYISVHDDRQVLADQPAIGGWESLVPEETPAVEPFPGITVTGRFFSTVTGEPWHAIEATDFSLFKLYMDGGDVRAILQQRREIGFNLLRVWLLNASVMPELSPRTYPLMYDQLPLFLDVVAEEGMAVELTAFTMVTGDTGLLPNESDQRNHWDRIVAACQGRNNVLLEVYNEGDQYGGANRPTISISKPSGVISSRGSNGSDSEPPDHGSPWDYEIYHIIGNAWQRKPGHNAMEWADQSGKPCITNESTRFTDKDTSTEHAYDSAAGGALLCAGTCFHSQEGKSSLLFTGQALECAKAFVAGVRSVPLEYRTGAYGHHIEKEGPQPDGSFVIRCYSRTLGDGRQWFVNIRGTPDEQ